MKTFKHSGNLGDIIYSLPTIIALGGGKLYIGNGTGNLGVSDGCPPPYPMTEILVLQIIDLLKLQPYLSDVKPYGNEKVDYNLDKFREHYPSDDHLAEWHLKTFGVKFNLGRAWLENIEPRYVNDIIISHSGRYITHYNKFNWGALKGYEDRCAFIGFEKEHLKFKKYTGLDIKIHPVKSLIEFAQIIKGGKVYIGNQSLGFAFAEALKCPRVVEICYFDSNCMPQTTNGYIQLTKRLLRDLLGGGRTGPVNPRIDNICANIRNFLFHSFTEGGTRSMISIYSGVKKHVPSVERLKKFAGY